MSKDITPKHLRCHIVASCPGVYDLGDGRLLIVGHMEFDWWTREQGGNPGQEEMGVTIPIEYFSALPELSRLRAENERLREALEEIKVGADNQGPFTGMSWLQVRELCDKAFDGCQADVSAVGTRSSPSALQSSAGEDAKEWAKALRCFIALSQDTESPNVLRVMFSKSVDASHRMAIVGAINTILLQAQRPIEEPRSGDTATAAGGSQNPVSEPLP